MCRPSEASGQPARRDETSTACRIRSRNQKFRSLVWHDDKKAATRTHPADAKSQPSPADRRRPTAYRDAQAGGREHPVEDLDRRVPSKRRHGLAGGRKTWKMAREREGRGRYLTVHDIHVRQTPARLLQCCVWRRERIGAGYGTGEVTERKLEIRHRKSASGRNLGARTSAFDYSCHHSFANVVQSSSSATAASPPIDSAPADRSALSSARVRVSMPSSHNALNPLSLNSTDD